MHRTRPLAPVILLLAALATLWAPFAPGAGASETVTLSGKVSEVVAELDGGGHRSGGFTLDAGEQGIWDLTGPLAAALTSGASARVTGIRTGPYRLTVTSIAPGPSVASFNAFTGTRRILALKVTLPGHRDLRDVDGTAISTAQVHATLTDTAEFYTNVSSGQLTLTHQVHDPVLRLGADSDTACWSLTRITNEGRAAVASLNPSGFQHVLFVMPSSYGKACDPGVRGRAIVGGSYVWTSGFLNQGTISHELAHNLGSDHLGALHCTGTANEPVSISGKCVTETSLVGSTAIAFKDDLIGAASWHAPWGQCAFHRAMYGWITPQTVTTTGSYLLARTGRTNPGADQLIRVRRADGTYLYLDVRAAGPTSPLTVPSSTAAASTPTARDEVLEPSQSPPAVIGPPFDGAALHETGHSGCCCPDCAPAPVGATSPTNQATIASTSNRLVAGSSLASGEFRTSANGAHRLTMQTDGNLVLRRLSDNTAVWSSNTAGNPGARVMMQTDGNLVVYRSNNTPVWSSGTPGTGADRAVVLDDGQLVVTIEQSGYWRYVWTSVVGLTGNTSSTLGPGTALRAGNYLTSPDGRYRFVMQSDGNLVLYQGTDPRWHTRTAGNAGAHAFFTTSGELRVWSPASAGAQRVLFSTNSADLGASRATLGNDGILRLNLPDGRAVWQHTTGLTGTAANALTAGSTLASGATLRSLNRAVTLTMQTDGNLTLRSTVTGATLWASNTAGNPGARVMMQTDGNLVVYRTDNTPVWSSNTARVGATARLVVLDDGQLRVQTPAAGVAWSTGEPLLDNPARGPMTAGISIRLATEHGPGARGAMVDTTPNTPNVFTDAPLVQGAELVDTAGGVRIKHNGFDTAGNARLAITAPTETAPALPVLHSVGEGGNNVTVKFSHSGGNVTRFELGRTRSETDTTALQVVATGTAEVRQLAERNRNEGVWYYRVRAIGTNNLASGWSNRSGGITFDWTAPSVPGSLAATKVGRDVELSWKPSTDVGRGVSRYRVYRNNVFASDTTATTIRIPAGPDNSTYQVSAVDISGNESPRASVVK